jgi:hypothetical protein
VGLHILVSMKTLGIMKCVQGRAQMGVHGIMHAVFAAIL